MFDWNWTGHLIEHKYRTGYSCTMRYTERVRVFLRVFIIRAMCRQEATTCSLLESKQSAVVYMLNRKKTERSEFLRQIAWICWAIGVYSAANKDAGEIRNKRPIWKVWFHGRTSLLRVFSTVIPFLRKQARFFNTYIIHTYIHTYVYRVILRRCCQIFVAKGLDKKRVNLRDKKVIFFKRFPKDLEVPKRSLPLPKDYFFFLGEKEMKWNKNGSKQSVGAYLSNAIPNSGKILDP